jgi:wobble nucleotide-excising tRNase
MNEKAKPNPRLKDFENLQTLRDEVELHAHLIKEDLQSKYQGLEKDWEKLNSHFKTIRETAATATHEVNDATQLLVETVRDGYEKIKKSFH